MTVEYFINLIKLFFPFNFVESLNIISFSVSTITNTRRKKATFDCLMKWKKNDYNNSFANVFQFELENYECTFKRTVIGKHKSMINPKQIFIINGMSNDI